ncbi:MAG TPA: LPS export ABC transporter permease LptG [Steroidobacteraceae bacterium]|nr:LPS export ABC transporter permease LptG [Steroidobacteraceae bacterium]
MSTLGRYLIRYVLAYTGLVTLVLAALGSLFLFISQQDDIGVGQYTTSQAALYVLLNLPGYLVQLLPVATLIGALLGLGNLARGSELVVMRASGITIAQFCRWLAVAGLILAAIILLVQEFAAPPLGKYARQMKLFTKFSQFSFAGNTGMWVRDGETIISVAQQSASTRYGGVQVFRIVPGKEMLSVGRAETASVSEDRRWRLQNYAETRFGPMGTDSSQVAEQDVHTTLSPEFLGLAVVEAESMGLRDLLAYMDHLRRNNLQDRSFLMEFWARLARIAGLPLVVILALPFSLGPMRSSGQGARTVIGILIGAAFVLLSQTLENGGQLFSLPPVIIGWVPTAVLAALTGVLLWRVR